MERPDDPMAPGHASWHALIGQIVVSFVPRRDGESWRSEPVFYEIADARVDSRSVFLLIRQWPTNEEQWVGGEMAGMFSMSRRPDGGFQVAGEKFPLVGSAMFPVRELIAKASVGMDERTLGELKRFLKRPKGTERVEQDASDEMYEQNARFREFGRLGQKMTLDERSERGRSEGA